MTNLRGVGKLVVAQSGGPTAVINASLAGVVQTANERSIPAMGARFGFEGLLAGDYLDLSAMSAHELKVLARTPAAGLGSSRYKPSDAEIDQVVKDLQARDVRWLVMIGGNDSADVMHRIHEAAARTERPLAVVGVPKTVDNDLAEMDHTPGYGSAARAVALFVRGTALDTSSMRRTDPVKIVEVAGRNSGWLAAGAVLAREEANDPPHIVFLPERPRSSSQMVAEIGEVLGRESYAVVVLCENQRDPSGQPLAGGEPSHTDAYGHAYFESPGQVLVRAVREQLGAVARYERPGSILRSLSGAQSKADLSEAEAAGAEATWLALAGASDVMVGLQREPGRAYRVRFNTVPLTSIAGQERVLPDAFIHDSGIDVTSAFLDYVRPLTGGPLPAILRLD